MTSEKLTELAEEARAILSVSWQDNAKCASEAAISAIRYDEPPKTPTGESHPISKLTEASVTEMRSRYRDGELLSELAEVYGVSVSTVWRAVKGLSWAHVPGAVNGEMESWRNRQMADEARRYRREQRLRTAAIHAIAAYMTARGEP